MSQVETTLTVTERDLLEVAKHDRGAVASSPPIETLGLSKT